MLLYSKHFCLRFKIVTLFVLNKKATTCFQVVALKNYFKELMLFYTSLL